MVMVWQLEKWFTRSLAPTVRYGVWWPLPRRGPKPKSTMVRVQFH